MIHCGLRSREEIVQYRYVVTEQHKTVNKMGADKTRTTGHQDTFAA